MDIIGVDMADCDELPRVRANFPAWATPGEKRKKYGRAIGLGADESILSDEDVTDGFLESKGIKFYSFIFDLT